MYVCSHIQAHTYRHTDMHTYEEYESIHGNNRPPIQDRSYLCQAWGSGGEGQCIQAVVLHRLLQPYGYCFIS